MVRRRRDQTQQVNVRAFVAIALVALWGVVLVAAGVFDPARQTPPSQFDYDAGSSPPTAGERGAAALQAVAMITTLPVTVLALCIAASSLRVWKEQVSAVIATGVTSLAALAAIGLAWIGVGTFVFFA